MLAICRYNEIMLSIWVLLKNEVKEGRTLYYHLLLVLYFNDFIKFLRVDRIGGYIDKK